MAQLLTRFRPNAVPVAVSRLGWIASSSDYIEKAGTRHVDEHLLKAASILSCNQGADVAILALIEPGAAAKNGAATHSRHQRFATPRRNDCRLRTCIQSTENACIPSVRSTELAVGASCGSLNCIHQQHFGLVVENEASQKFDDTDQGERQRHAAQSMSILKLASSSIASQSEACCDTSCAMRPQQQLARAGRQWWKCTRCMLAHAFC